MALKRLKKERYKNYNIKFIKFPSGNVQTEIEVPKSISRMGVIAGGEGDNKEEAFKITKRLINKLLKNNSLPKK